MKPFEIWSYQPPGWDQPHPAVIVSGPGRVATSPEINVIMCSSHRAMRDARPNEVILDENDGLSWKTLCKCDLIHLVPRSAITNRRGEVTPERRRQIISTMIRANGWF